MAYVIKVIVREVAVVLIEYDLTMGKQPMFCAIIYRQQLPV